MTQQTDKQAAFWALGDYGSVGATIADLGADLVAAAGVSAGARVLDVGAGTGNASLPAAAAGATVVATDITPELMAVGERAATERGLAVEWRRADARSLPFPDGSFDVVLSCLGAMFADDHPAAAAELLRVCKPGGTVAMANWTPGGGVGRFFALLARYGPPGPAGPPPTAWGDPAHVAQLFAPAARVDTRFRTVRLRFTGSPADLAEHYRTNFAPVIATAAMLDGPELDALHRELVELIGSPGYAVPQEPGRYELEYLQVLAIPQ